MNYCDKHPAQLRIMEKNVRNDSGDGGVTVFGGLEFGKNYENFQRNNASPASKAYPEIKYSGLGNPNKIFNISTAEYDTYDPMEATGVDGTGQEVSYKHYRIFNDKVDLELSDARIVPLDKVRNI